jgi:hypothetical protein
VGHYFRALISIDEELFDTQSWSRFDNYSATKNLRYLYKAYFETVFTTTFTPGVTEQTHLKKKVSITIEERLMADDSLVTSIDLPEFYILHNIKPVSFSDTTKIQLLGINADKILVPVNGKISIPVYTNTAAESVVITLKDNFNTVIDTQTIASATAKKVHLYNYDLANHTFATNTIYFILSVTVGSTTLTQAFRYLQFPDYEIKEIAYLNNFGFFVYAYLDGRMSIDNGLSSETYDQENGTEKIIEINEDFTYTINTGSLLASEKETINQIVNALEAKLYFNGEWIDMTGRTKKIKDYEDRLNNYSESLVFGVKRNPSVANDFYDVIEDPELNLTSANSEDGETYELTFDFNFPIYNLTLEGKVGDDWITVKAVGITSPATVTVNFFAEYFRLKSTYNTEDIYSNEIVNPIEPWASSE